MTMYDSIDWFKGTITGKSHISWENLWFPVDFPSFVNPLILIVSWRVSCRSSMILIKNHRWGGRSNESGHALSKDRGTAGNFSDDVVPCHESGWGKNTHESWPSSESESQFFPCFSHAKKMQDKLSQVPVTHFMGANLGYFSGKKSGFWETIRVTHENSRKHIENSRKTIVNSKKKIFPLLFLI